LRLPEEAVASTQLVVEEAWRQLVAEEASPSPGVGVASTWLGVVVALTQPEVEAAWRPLEEEEASPLPEEEEASPLPEEEVA
jgi:uncharacterized membrane protein